MATTPLLDPLTELPLVQGFGDFPAELIAELASIVVQRRVGPQELAEEQGQPAVGLLLLVRGAVKLVRHVATSQGEVARVLDVLRASSVVPSPSFLDGQPADAGVVALRTSHVFVLERRAVQRLTAGYPLLERALLARFARDARVHARRTDELAAGPVEERVHRLLERLSNQYGTPLGNGRFIALPLRRKDLASMVNATTETVSRLLAKLEREGQVRSTRDGIWWRSAARPIPQAASQAASQHAGPSASQAASQAANQAVPPPIPAVPSSRRGV